MSPSCDVDFCQIVDVLGLIGLAASVLIKHATTGRWFSQKDLLIYID